MTNLEEIEALLLRVGELVRQLEPADPAFVSAVGGWLASVELTLQNNRLPLAAGIAAMRGVLITAERAERAGAGGSGTPASTRRMREVRVAGVLKDATDQIAASIKSRRIQVDEALSITMQIVAVADRAGLIPPIAPGQGHTAYLQSVLRALSERPELGSHVAHVTGLLGTSDSLLMLDRAIARVRQ